MRFLDKLTGNEVREAVLVNSYYSPDGDWGQRAHLRIPLPGRMGGWPVNDQTRWPDELEPLDEEASALLAECRLAGELK